MNDHSAPEFNEISLADFLKFVTESDKNHIIGMVDRPGVTCFFGFIEYNWYPPGSIRSNLLVMNVVRWQDIYWTVGSVPNDKMGAIRQLASFLRLHLSDGIPTILEGGPLNPHGRVSHGLNADYFPGGILPNGENNLAMLTIESMPTNPLHNREHGINHALVRDRESRVLTAMQNHKRPKPQDIYNYIYGFEPHPKWLD